MPRKNIYVAEADEEVWEKAEKLAEGSISSLVAGWMREFVDERERQEEQMQQVQQEMGPIEVELGGRDIPKRTVRFQGTWLVEPQEDYTRTAEPHYDAGAYYGVASTRRGRIAVYCAHVNERFDATLDTYPSLEAAEAADVPKDIINEARRGLDPYYVEELDI